MTAARQYRARRSDDCNCFCYYYRMPSPSMKHSPNQLPTFDSLHGQMEYLAGARELLYGHEPDLHSAIKQVEGKSSKERQIAISFISDTGKKLAFLGVTHYHNPDDYRFEIARAFSQQTLREGNRYAKVFIEGRIRGIEPHETDEDIFSQAGAIGLVEAYALRNGIPLDTPEPDYDIAAPLLAYKFGTAALTAYLGLRVIPQWVGMHSRPSIHETITPMLGYFGSVLGETPQYKPVGKLLGTPATGYGYFLHAIQSIYDWDFDEYIQPTEAWADFAKRQTTHEPILLYTQPEERTPVQRLALEFNLWRDRRLISVVRKAQ